MTKQEMQQELDELVKKLKDLLSAGETIGDYDKLKFQILAVSVRDYDAREQEKEFLESLVKGDIFVIQRLLNEKPGLVNTKFEFGETPIMVVLREYGSYAGVSTAEALTKILLSKMDSKALKDTNDQGATVLHCVANYVTPSHALDVGKMILDKLIPDDSSELCDAVDSLGETAFYLAISGTKPELAELLIEKMSKDAILLPTKCYSGDTVAHHAVRSHFTPLLNKMLHLPYEFFNIKNKAGETPLQLAKTIGHNIMNNDIVIDMLSYKTLPLGDIINSNAGKGSSHVAKIKEGIAKGCKSLPSLLRKDITKLVYEYVVDKTIIDPNEILVLQYHPLEDHQEAAVMHVGSSD